MSPKEAAAIAGLTAPEVPGAVKARCESPIWARVPSGGRGVSTQVYLATAPATEWMPHQAARAARMAALKREYPGEYAR